MASKRTLLEVRKGDVDVRLPVGDDSIEIQDLHRTLGLGDMILSAGGQRLDTVIGAFLHRANTREHHAILDIVFFDGRVQRLEQKVIPVQPDAIHLLDLGTAEDLGRQRVGCTSRPYAHLHGCQQTGMRDKSPNRCRIFHTFVPSPFLLAITEV